MLKARMPTEIAAGIIVFRVTVGRIREYLVLQSARGHWEFPKGHLDGGETWEQAALRELDEEAGISDATMIPGFSRQIRYFFSDKKRQLVDKVVYFAVAQTRSAARLSDEHTASDFLPFEQALKRLTHAGTRSVLREAEIFLQRCDHTSRTS